MKVGLKPVMMKHAYNIHYQNNNVHQVANWQEIYNLAKDHYNKKIESK
jgi:hypothetical protein